MRSTFNELYEKIRIVIEFDIVLGMCIEEGDLLPLRTYLYAGPNKGLAGHLVSGCRRSAWCETIRWLLRRSFMMSIRCR